MVMVRVVAGPGSRKYHVDDAHAMACRLTFRVLTWGICEK
jgi:hypothetical protein